MMRNIVLGMVLLVTTTLLAQIGINTGNVSQYAALQIDASEQGKGMLIPQISTVKRDQNFSAQQLVEGFLIYNTDEKCFNYWEAEPKKWKNLCGSVGKAVYTLEDCSLLKGEGVYVAGQLMETNNYVTVTVDVKKPGTYTLLAVSREDNGYYFSAGGEFGVVGKTTVKLYAQGKPITPKVDTFDVLTTSGAKTPGCNFMLEVADPNDKPLFTLDCKSVKFTGLYKLGQVLNESHTLKMTINVTENSSGASYEVQTNEIDGVSFRGSGKLRVGTGNQEIVLQGYGVPLTNLDKQLQIRSNSQDPLVRTCSVTLRFSAPAKKMVVYGGDSTKDWSIVNPNSGVRKMLETEGLFGDISESLVQFGGWERIDNGGNTIPSKGTSDTNPNYIKTKIPYDIVVIENNMTTISEGQSEALINFMQQGGVVIMLVDQVGFIRPFTSFLTSMYNVQAKPEGKNNSVYGLSNSNTAILNGPFGDVRGKYWGAAAAVTILEKLNSGAFEVLSEATDYAEPAPELPEIPDQPVIDDDAQPSDDDDEPEVESHGKEGVTMMTEQTYHYLWIGSATFNSSSSGFALDQQNKPIARDGFGHTRGQTVTNAILMANAFGWAIRSSTISE